MELIMLFIGMITSLFIDAYCNYKYGYPSLSILFAWFYCSKRFKWLVFNVWGNDDWYFERVSKRVGFK